MTYEAAGTLLMDDFEGFELEVTSLREATRQNGSPEADGHGDTSQADGVPIVSPAPHVGMRRTSHRRLVQMVIAGVCVLALLALVLGRSPATTALVGDMFGIVTPTPTAPLALGMDKIYPIYSVPWGTLRIDGRVQTFVVQRGDYRPVRLSRGSHTLEYQAAPFPTLRCTISAPAAPTDTCPLLNPETTPSSLPFDPVPPDTRGLGREIDLGATPNRLPASQRAALSTAIDAALNVDTAFHTNVAPSERYATANGGVAVATQPLAATLRVTHTPRADVGDGMAGHTIYGDSACADICADVFPFGGNLSDAEWSLAVAATLAWRYTAANGSVVAEAPLVPGSTGLVATSSQTDYNAHIEVQWERQQWTVHRIDMNSLGASILGNSVCALGQILIDNMYADLNMHEANAYNTAQVASYMPPQPADGCYLTYQRGTTAGKKEATSGFLFRLGVLLAANAQAQRLFPKLPVADARDHAIIRQMGAPAT